MSKLELGYGGKELDIIFLLFSVIKRNLFDIIICIINRRSVCNRVKHMTLAKKVKFC